MTKTNEYNNIVKFDKRGNLQPVMSTYVIVPLSVWAWIHDN